MRWSSPMALATTCTSAPTRSQRFATSLIKDTLVARNALEVYLIISAVAMSVKRNRVPIKQRGRDRSRMIASGSGQSAPKTTRVWRMKASRAGSSRENAGLETVAEWGGGDLARARWGAGSSAVAGRGMRAGERGEGASCPKPDCAGAGPTYIHPPPPRRCVGGVYHRTPLLLTVLGRFSTSAPAMAIGGSAIQRPLAVMMSRQILSISPSAPVIEAARTMREAKVGALLVAEASRFVGIVSESDLVRNVLAVGGDANQMRVSQVMHAPLITIEIDRSAHEASDLMAERGIRHLAVTEDGKIVGILSVRDLLRYFKNWGTL